MGSILVQMAEHEWTMLALHRACSQAREQGLDVVLLRLMQVEHISYLGSEFGEVAITLEEYAQMQEYAATAEDYGVTLTVEQVQMLSPLDAVVDAAQELDARTIFACVPPSPIPLLRELRMHHLERRLRGTGRLLFTLDQAEGTQTFAPWLKASSPT
jgi:hypothetical protein